MFGAGRGAPGEATSLLLGWRQQGGRLEDGVQHAGVCDERVVGQEKREEQVGYLVLGRGAGVGPA